MTGVCIAIGEPWETIAIRACERMQEMTNVPCFPLTKDFDTVHPSWNKCFVLDEFKGEDGILLFDADIICLKPWNPVELWEKHNRAFLAVPDRNIERVEEECERYGIGFPDMYVNAGLTIFGREHKPIWDATFAKHPWVRGWLEQTPLNQVLRDYEKDGGKVVRLDRKYNRICGWNVLAEEVKGDTINAHLAGNGERPERIIAAQKELGWE